MQLAAINWAHEQLTDIIKELDNEGYCADQIHRLLTAVVTRECDSLIHRYTDSELESSGYEPRHFNRGYSHA